jgi:hypothetical protein
MPVSLRKPVDALPIPPILCTIAEAAQIIARGQSFIYEAIASNKIRAVKSDKRTLVVIESLRQYAANLPPAEIKPPKRDRRKSSHEMNEPRVQSPAARPENLAP